MYIARVQVVASLEPLTLISVQHSSGTQRLIYCCTTASKLFTALTIQTHALQKSMIFSRSLRCVFVAIALCVPFCTASLSSTFPNFKFMSSFSEYSDYFDVSSVENCNATLQAYLQGAIDRNDGIARHADCILANTTEMIKANMASAGVVLGLMPIILANLGSTLAETSILTLERPFLSLLLAIGGPSIYPARPFDY
jgi:hypothetical protein